MNVEDVRAMLAWIGRSPRSRVRRWNAEMCFLVLICLQVTLYML